MTPIDSLKKLAEAATPGPWVWRQHKISKEIDLAAPHGGGTIVMDFCRQGMQQAQPRFAITMDDEPRGRRGGILVEASALIERNPEKLLRHPDAEWIAAANPLEILSLIERVRAAEEIVIEHAAMLKLLETIDDIWRDGRDNAPEHRCYVDGALEDWMKEIPVVLNSVNVRHAALTKEN